MAKRPKLYGQSSKGEGLKKTKKVSGKDHLGQLMRKNRDLEDLLHGYCSRADFVYEDMEFTIEEFSDITGCDLDELLEEIEALVKKH